jgi:outer membrane protein assembly factor BamB
LWTSTSSDEGENVFEQTTSLAIANGVIYFRAGNGDAVGLDAAGSVGCSVTNGAKTCAPILNANPGNDRGTPIVANGVVYVSNLNTGTISAFSLPQ